MSDNWIIVFPEDAKFVPSEQAQRRAENLFRQLAPNAGNVESEASADIRFIDCGANLESVRCPDCGKDIEIDWWQEQMETEEEAGFPLAAIELPCCHSKRTLAEFKYDWPQGFARFTVEAMNPGIRDLTDANLAEFEAVLGCRVRKVLQHL